MTDSRAAASGRSPRETKESGEAHLPAACAPPLSRESVLVVLLAGDFHPDELTALSMAIHRFRGVLSVTAVQGTVEVAAVRATWERAMRRLDAEADEARRMREAGAL